MTEEMIQVKTISEDRLDEIAAEICASFYDYPYEAGEGGLKAMIPSREVMNAYMKALVRAGIASGTFYATSDRGEGYILLTDSFGSHPGAKALARMLREIKDALGGWKQAATFFKAATGGGETLETRRKKAKRPYASFTPTDGSTGLIWEAGRTFEVEIGAGWKTAAIWLWVKAFYAHRQRKWIKLLNRGGCNDA